RTRHRTARPFARRARTTCAPTKPVPPVTRSTGKVYGVGTGEVQSPKSNVQSPSKAEGRKTGPGTLDPSTLNVPWTWDFGPWTAPGYPVRFQATRRNMSPGCLGSSLTTDASKPECIAQLAQSGSWRDSQYSQFVPFQNSSHENVYFLPIR